MASVRNVKKTVIIKSINNLIKNAKRFYSFGIFLLLYSKQAFHIITTEGDINEV